MEKMYDVTVQRTVVETQTVGIMAESAAQAQTEVMKMPKVQRDAGWTRGEPSRIKANKAKARRGKFKLDRRGKPIRWEYPEA